MLILAIDTSTRTGSLAVLRGHTVLAQMVSEGETPYSERLFQDLAMLQDKAKFRIQEVDLFATTTGPGSFTGLRVSLTAVKAWSEVYGRPIAAVSGLEAIAAQARGTQGLLAPLLDARHGQVYGALYRRVGSSTPPSDDPVPNLRLLGEEAVLTLEEFAAMLTVSTGGEPVTIVSPTVDVLAGLPIETLIPGSQVVQVSANLAPIVGQLGFERALRGETVDALHLDANYVRRSDAEQLRKGA